MSAFHPEVMPPAQQRVLRQLGPLATQAGLYLAGGTAVAIHLGHRRSIDLDWFTPEAVSDPLVLADDLRRAGVDLRVTSTARGTLHAEAEGVKLSFLEYRYPALVAPVEWAAYGCRLAGLEDLAAMKLSAIASRGARKDFVDLWALGRTQFTLEEMLRLYQQKFATADLGHVLMSLSYFDDAEGEEMPEMLDDLQWSGMRRHIETWVADYARRHTPRG